MPTLVAAFLALLMLVGIGLAAPVAASGGSQADRVIAAAASHLGARYVWGSTGPHGFDCSGLVYRAFREARLAKHIGGFNTAHGYYYSFRKQGQDQPDATVGRATSWSTTTAVTSASTSATARSSARS